mgnify:CR=1 FL=1
MLNKILKDKVWIFGIIVFTVGIILSISLPLIFLSFQLIMGMLLIIVGIVMIHQIFGIKDIST